MRERYTVRDSPNGQWYAWAAADNPPDAYTRTGVGNTRADACRWLRSLRIASFSASVPERVAAWLCCGCEHDECAGDCTGCEDFAYLMDAHGLSVETDCHGCQDDCDACEVLRVILQRFEAGQIEPAFGAPPARGVASAKGKPAEVLAELARGVV